MSKLDVFAWLIVKCYSKVPRSSHRRCPIRPPFTEHLQTTASEFPQKDTDKCKESQKSESTKQIHLRRKKKKAQHGTEGNELKY